MTRSCFKWGDGTMPAMSRTKEAAAEGTLSGPVKPSKVPLVGGDVGRRGANSCVGEALSALVPPLCSP